MTNQSELLKEAPEPNTLNGENGHGKDNDETMVAARDLSAAFATIERHRDVMHASYYSAISDAARALANAFATIEEYRDYIPTRIYNGMADLIQELHDSSWASKPDVVRKALPHILRGTIEREMADKEAA